VQYLWRKTPEKQGPPIHSLVRKLHSLVPKPKVIVMSSNPEFGRKYFKAGADAFISKGDQPEWLFVTLQRWSSQPSSELNQS